MNGIDENVVVKKVFPLWQYRLIAFDIAMDVSIIGGVISGPKADKFLSETEDTIEQYKKDIRFQLLIRMSV